MTRVSRFSPWRSHRHDQVLGVEEYEMGTYMCNSAKINSQAGFRFLWTAEGGWPV